MTAPASGRTEHGRTRTGSAETTDETTGETAPGGAEAGDRKAGVTRPVAAHRRSGGRPAPRPPLERAAVRRLAPWTPRRIGVVCAVWLLITMVCAGLVCYGLGPLIESRQQRALLTDMRQDISRAVGAEASLFGGRQQTTRAPELGDPVAIVQIPRMRLQQVVVEGAGSRRTQGGPGHVPGTAGPGQPGNAAVVARRYGFGAPFRRLETLRAGDDIIVSTTQGTSLYQVRSVDVRKNLAREDVYTASTDDRLTLVTSAAVTPWEGRRAVVVVASMSGLPYPATPQGGRARVEDGRHGDPSALALVVLYGALFAGAAVAAVLLYRRWLSASTYLLTTPVMIALIVLTAEAATRLLPAWT